jgi:hypothetical protein
MNSVMVKLRYIAGFSVVISSWRGPSKFESPALMAGLKNTAREALASWLDLIITLWPTLWYSLFETSCTKIPRKKIVRHVHVFFFFEEKPRVLHIAK